jgi:hypothetical protein
MRKKKNNKDKLYFIGMITCIGIAVICLVVYFSEDNQRKRALQKEGYTIEADDPFYKKVVTGNTLDSYYKNIANNEASSYEEYYVSKETYNFMEQKLNYMNGVSTALNISSDLRNLSIKFTFELSYEDAYLILEGGTNNGYQCETVVNERVLNTQVYEYCDQVQSELEAFSKRRAEILANEKIQEYLQNAPSIIDYYE